MCAKAPLIYIACVLTGFVLSIILQSVNFRDAYTILEWFRDAYSSLSNMTFRGSKQLQLLTIVDHQKKNFVAVLPSKEIQEADLFLSHELSAILNKAIEFKAAGKRDKAMKLLRQCKSLNPRNPDVLNMVGEELEPSDVIGAEHHYALALVNYPGHLKALENRRRCLPRVNELDMKMLQRIEKKREALMSIPEGNLALTRAKLEAYYKHIYHTNGIEGNTLTLSMTRAIVETGMAVGGKSVIEHNEVLGLDAALKYINTTLLNQIGPVTLSQILEIHKRVLGHSNPLDAGLYRQSQVYVGSHAPPSPLEIGKYMRAFQNWLLSPELDLLHAIELAALSHYKLVYIHPFLDGNGRTSRLLMNVFLMRAGYPPVIIRKESRFEYYQHLETANMGDVRPFIRFIAKCTEESLDEYLSSVTVGKLQMDDLDTGETSVVNYDKECFNPFQHVKSLTQGEANGKCEKRAVG